VPDAPLSTFQTRSDSPIPLSSKEATFTVPRNPTDILQTRIDKLEQKFDDNIAETRKLDRGLASLEPKIDAHAKDLQKLDRHFDSLRTLVEDRTSASRAVTWTQLGALLFILLIPIAGPASSVFYAYILPQKIETVISGSSSLNTKLSAIDEKLKPINEKLTAIQGDTKSVNTRLDLIESIVFPNLTRRTVATVLQKEMSGSAASLSEALPRTRSLLGVVKKEKLALQREDYKALSGHLLAAYSSAQEPLRQELWETIIEAANTRSVADPTRNAQAEAELIRRAKEAGSYFEGVIDLSTKSSWKDAIFQNCKIIISNPDAPILLDGVRFINCDFQGGDNGSNRELLTAFLENVQPTLSATLGPKGEVSSVSLTSPKVKSESKSR
jgi:outer membrane murein-binding lipoprotein Lpp